MFLKTSVLLAIVLVTALARPQDQVAVQQPSQEHQQQLGMDLAQSILKYIGIDTLSKDGNFNFTLHNGEQTQKDIPKEITENIKKVLNAFGLGEYAGQDVTLNFFNTTVTNNNII